MSRRHKPPSRLRKMSKRWRRSLQCRRRAGHPAIPPCRVRAAFRLLRQPHKRRPPGMSGGCRIPPQGGRRPRTRSLLRPRRCPPVRNPRRRLRPRLKLPPSMSAGRGCRHRPNPHCSRCGDCRRGWVGRILRHRRRWSDCARDMRRRPKGFPLCRGCRGILSSKAMSRSWRFGTASRCSLRSCQRRRCGGDRPPPSCRRSAGFRW